VQARTLSAAARPPAGTIINGGLGVHRIIWSWAGATGLLDGKGLDVAYAGQGDDLNLSEFATAAFAGVRRGFAGANDLINWVNVSLTETGDTVVQFDKSGSRKFSQIAVTLKNDSLFANFGVTDHSSISAQQVVQDRCSTGRLLLNHTHCANRDRLSRCAGDEAGPVRTKQA
jgi:hypothetical protein